MKKTLLFAAALCAGAAHSQSSVTLFGVVDTNYTRGSGSIASKTQLSNSGNVTSRLGLRGTEDLGGGLSASFWLEAGISTDDGQGGATNTNNQTSGTAPGAAGRQGLTFNRRSTVSLAGAFGEVRLGRDYTAHFWNTALFDPFGTIGLGTNHLLNAGLGGVATPNGVRSSNAISYLTPSTLGGFYGQFQAYLGENNSGTVNAKDGSGYSARGGWAVGPADVAVSVGKTRFATGDVDVANVAASWKFAPVKLMGEYYRDRVDSPTQVTGKGYLVGLTAPIGAGEVKASYASYKTSATLNPKSSKFTIGYVHNLSKRTAVYGTFGRIENGGGTAFALGGAVTAPNNSSKGYDIGLRHSF